MLEGVGRLGVDLGGVTGMREGEDDQYTLYKCMEFLKN